MKGTNSILDNTHINEIELSSKTSIISDEETAKEVLKHQEDLSIKQDPNNPISWPKSKKITIMVLVSANSFIGYFSSAVYMPATLDIMADFDTNLTVINATVALFLLVNAIGPLFIAPLSEKIGRRWIYFFGMVLYTVCTIICGISKSLGLFFTFRLLQGVFGSIGQAIGGGSASDIFEPHERGKAMSIYILSTIFGPAIAPLVGGYIDEYLGWRWIFYFKTIIGGVLSVLNLFFLKETLYIQQQVSTPKNFKERLSRLAFNPFTSLNLLLKPEVGLTTIPISLVFGWYYYLVTILPETYSTIYHFNTGTIGLCYLAGGVGNISGGMVNGIISDRLYARSTRRNGGVAIKEHRLYPIYVGVVLLTIGSILYGWLLHLHVHWIGVLIVYVATGFGNMFTIAVANTYLVDTNPTKAASVVASNNLTRNICGMVLSLTAVQIRGSLGDGWSYTLYGIMCFVAFIICIPIVQKYGPKWRENK